MKSKVNFSDSKWKNYTFALLETKSRRTSVSIVTRLRPGRPGFNFRQGVEFLSSPPHVHQQWGPRSLVSNESRGFFPRGLSDQVVKLTTYPYLVLGLKRGAILPLPQYCFMAWCLIKQWVRIHGVVFI
jgi:hypothetical protein